MKSNRNDFKHISCKKLRFPFLIIFIMFQLFITINANAGVPRVSAKKPFVFSDAAINVVVLQYTYVGKDEERFSETGERLSLLIQQSILHSILKFRSVGAVQIVLNGNKEENKPDVIFDKILGRKPGALDKRTIRKNHILVFLWGHIYEENDAIYVQSYIRFLRHGVTEKISMSFTDNLKRKLELRGSLPFQTFAFAPRRLTVQDLNRLDSEFEKNILVRTEPNSTARGYPLVREKSGIGAYSVVESRDEWMKIDPQSEGLKTGWIRTGVSLKSAEVKSQMPELYFVEAVAGYLRYQMMLDETFPGEIQHKWIYKAVDNYAKIDARNKRSHHAIALAQVIMANLIIQTEPYSIAEHIDRIINCYSTAVNLIPYNADARNLKTCANIGKGHINGWEKIKPMKFADDFNNALSLDPGNSLVLANLETFYSYLASLPNSVQLVPQKELKDKLEAVKQVRTGIKKLELKSQGPVKK